MGQQDSRFINTSVKQSIDDPSNAGQVSSSPLQGPKAGIPQQHRAAVDTFDSESEQ